MAVLLVGLNLTLGSGITKMLEGVVLPLKAHVRSWERRLDLALLQTVQPVVVARSAPYQLRLGEKDRTMVTHILVASMLQA